jgi:hypothetical protein
MKKAIVATIVLIAVGGYGARADDAAGDQAQKAVHAVCAAGRMGVALTDVTGIDDDKRIPKRLKDIWEGCRQESVKDLSCYPFTQNGKDRTIYLPSTQPANARFEPLTADCKGRVGRWPAWRDSKEDKSETLRMGLFYANNPPGELPANVSR